MRKRTLSSAAPSPAIGFAVCPAKTFNDDGITRPGRPVPEHCQIVGEVARALISGYPSALQTLFPAHAAFAAACHDIGKVSPTFVEKLRRNFSQGVSGLPTIALNPELERQWGGHAGVSQAAAKAMDVPRWLPEILGQHHGFSPQLGGKTALAEQFGGAPWQQERIELVNELKRRLDMDWPQIESEAQARLVAGLTSVADWIGSGQHFENPDEPWREKIALALNESGFIPASYQSGLSFEQVFGFAPRPAQEQLITIATGAGVYVLEAPMGLGKTEAALYAAYQMLQSGQACGIYFALPTQLTSNKIHQRFNDFLQRILAPNCPHRHALLLHGKAWLQNTEMGEEGRPGGAWFSQAKRGLLAPFAVGTVDQALMAAMNVKHGFVRAFGLAGKVVILDEVHSYDAYTGTLLDALVSLLRELKCTVIILSATLNRARRRELLQAEVKSEAYPLISAVQKANAIVEQAVPVEGSNQIGLHLEQDTALAVAEALARAERGEQVLWIENTVKDAQERYRELAARALDLGLEAGLLHSRFTASNRQQIESHWVDLFGKPGWARRAERGRILVGTQVLEQSLDIDADFLVSRFAPTDMLLQRIGRLWRHKDTPRPSGARCEAWLLAPALGEAIEAPHSAFGATAYVYSPYVLCRALEVWQSRSSITLPDDIRPLIEATYIERVEEDAMARWLHELNHGTQGHRERKGRLALQQLARIGLAHDGKTLPESKAQTRYSETESLEVLLLRDMQLLKEKQASRLILLDGTEVLLPWRKRSLSLAAWKALTARLMEQMVPVSIGDAPQPVVRDTLEKYGLQHCFYLGSRDWEEDESLLRLALVDEAGSLRGLHGQSAHDKKHLEYSHHLGYCSTKEN